MHFPKLNATIRLLAFLLLFQKALGTNLNLQSSYTDSGSQQFYPVPPHQYQDNVTSFSIHYSLINIPFYANTLHS